MAGLVPATSFLPSDRKDVDARHKAGHDEVDATAQTHSRNWQRARTLPTIAKPWHHTPNNKTEIGFSGGGDDDPSPRVAFERFAARSSLP